MPNGVSIPMGRVYQTYGSSIDIEITLPKLDKNETLATAKEDIRTTLAIAEANNQQVANWAASFELIIDSTLEQRRKELLDFYS